MTKGDLVKKLAVSASITQDQADAAIKALAVIIAHQVQRDGDSISIPQLGTFRQVKTHARVGRNPKTGEVIDIPAAVKIGFKMSSSLK